MLSIDIKSRTPIHEQLQNNIIQCIVLGIYSPGEQLPSVRSLANELSVNPNTVQKAYRILEERGVLYTVAGKGAFVSDAGSSLSKVREIEKKRFAESAAAAKNKGLTESELIEIVAQLYKGGKEND